MAFATHPGIAACLIVGAYLLGSVASAIVISRLMGLPDPRGGGSGNPGATNVLRLGGKKAAVFTLIGDVLKGLIPVLIAAYLGADPTLLVCVAIAAFLGHLYPVFFGFAGGKGVATALGVLSGISWSLGGAVLLSWLTVVAITRYSSLSALVASLLAPVLAHLIVGAVPITAGTAVIAALLIWRHRGNIQRLLAGEEDKLGAKRPPAEAPTP